MKIHAVIFAIVISASAFFSKPAAAATLLVTTTADSGPGSLRAQIAAAQPGDLILCTNLTAQTLTLTSGQIVISNSSLTIQGAGLSISANNASRIFLITSNSTVNLMSIFLINGTVTGDSGGAIRNDGTLSLTSCSFQNDTAIGGAGATLVVGQNGGGGGGGAGLGGAIFSDGPSLSLFGCTFRSDTAQGGNGGAGNTHGFLGNNGGNGGGPNAGTGGVGASPGNGGGFGGGGGGGGDAGLNTGYNGGAGGFGGGGGGGGANLNGNIGGSGGAGGLYGGTGGMGVSYSGGGGGGAGLGGAVFTLGGTISITSCDFEQNLATNGIGGANAANGQGMGASLFLYGTTANVASNTFSGNVASSSPAGDVYLSVTNANDSGPGSLRDTIIGVPTGATLTFDPSLAGKSIYLDLIRGQILLTNNMVIDASALPGGITISGNSFGRIFQVASNITVTLKSLNLVGGTAAVASGGAIYSEGTLVALNCSFNGNSASGSIGLYGGVGNAGGGGGGAGLGGAIFSDGPALILGGCTFTNNSVQGANGGGIEPGSPGGTPGAGGGPNGGGIGLNNRDATGIGGGGSGGGGSAAGGFRGGQGGFGGGGGGGGGYSGSGQVGAGGLGGSFGGNGGSSTVGPPTHGGAGGGGAGLGGAVFSLSPLSIITNCSFTANSVASGQGGFGGAAAFNGGNGQALGAAIFAYGSSILTGNTFQGNIAASGPAATLAVAVANTGDGGVGSLRFLMTNIVDGETTIIFTSGQTITVTNGPLVPTKSVTIDASALSQGATLNGGGSNRLFQVNSGVSVILNNITLSQGTVSGDGGGAIRNDGNFTAINCTFTNNTAHGGAGQTVPSNGGTAGGGGGGGGAGMGGAIYSDGPTLTLTGCTFAGNQAQGGKGGDGNGVIPANYVAAGNGGGPNGGLGGDQADGSPGGFGGGGGGGSNGTQSQSTFYNGGAGGFGGGGGGTGGWSGIGGVGGPGGVFGGAGETYDFKHPSACAGGGGGGLGGAIFTVNSAATISGCLFTNNVAMSGVGGSPSGANGQAWGGALFLIGVNLATNNNSFVSNSAATAMPDQFTESDTLSFTTVGQKLQVSWPTNAIGYHVQYATNLTPPIVWQALNGSVSNNGTLFQQSLTNVTIQSAFFRLSPVAP